MRVPPASVEAVSASWIDLAADAARDATGSAPDLDAPCLSCRIDITSATHATATTSDTIAIVFLRSIATHYPRESMDVEIVFDDGATRFVCWRNVYVQVRKGPLTLEALDLMIATWRMRQQKAPSRTFAFFVVTRDAEPPSAEVRARQGIVIDEVMDTNRLEGALVVEGEGALADTHRALAHGVSKRRPQIHATVEEAARAVAKFADAPTEKEILEVIRIARG